LQRQRPAAVDLDAFGHLMAAGAPRSGRSQLLRTLAAAAAASHTCADLHLYGLDGGQRRVLVLLDRWEGFTTTLGCVLATCPRTSRPARGRPHRRPPAPRLHRPPRQARPGRALLNTGDGTLVTIAVPVG
jgi:hypothetical protein